MEKRRPERGKRPQKDEKKEHRTYVTKQTEQKEESKKKKKKTCPLNPGIAGSRSSMPRPRFVHLLYLWPMIDWWKPSEPWGLELQYQ